jgi:IS1 family transposase
VRNGKKYNGPQNYLCKDCKKQFISDHERTYRGSILSIGYLIKMMLVHGNGIRDISAILKISIYKVLTTLISSRYEIKPQKKYYDTLEVDEFWTYVGNKKNKIWLIYAYDRGSGEIVAYVWGKRDFKTADKLRRRLKRLEVRYNRIATDEWGSFLKAFKDDELLVGKQYTVGIEGNNCRLRQRIRRVFRKTCCFSKKLRNHWKAFSMAFFYINYGYV